MPAWSVSRSDAECARIVRNCGRGASFFGNTARDLLLDLVRTGADSKLIDESWILITRAGSCGSWQHMRSVSPRCRRIFQMLRRIDEDGNIYDLVRVFFEEYRFFPFSPRDDLIDAMARIYDMDPRAAVQHETVETPDHPDS